MQMQYNRSIGTDMRDHVETVCGPLHFEFPESVPRALPSLEMVTFEECRISRLRMGPHRMRATRQRLNKVDAPAVKLIFQMSGTQIFSTASNRHALHPGNWAMFDPLSEYQTDCADAICQMLVELPRDTIPPGLLAHLHEPRIFSGGFLCGPMSMMLEQTLDRIALSRSEAQPALDHMGETLLAMSRPFQRMTSNRIGLRPSAAQTLRDRFLAHVGERLHDPNLSVGDIAKRLNCSRRHLYSAFEAADMSPAQAIRDLRLDRAHAALIHHGAENVSKIAFAHGFTSASHFSRAFKARYNCSPSQLLRRPH